MSVPSSEAESWTVLRLIEWTSAYLKRKGSPTPRLDTEVLLADVLEWPRFQLYVNFESPVGTAERARFKELIKRRAEGEPVAYLVGRKDFHLLTLEVNRSVLIPRPDSEFVVVELLAHLEGRIAPHIVDVGTGSGNLALIPAHQRDDLRVEAVDLSPDALALARSNAERFGLCDRVTFHQGDLLEPISKLDLGLFDAIISNPPYIATDVIATLEPGVRDYEPHLALDGGPDGLDIVRRLIPQAIPLLQPDGALILEIGSDQETHLRDLLVSYPELSPKPTVRDHSGHPRVLVAVRNTH